MDNIVANALRHTPNGGQITVRVKRNAGAVVIEVQDSGEGIPLEHLPHVFERFYKAASTTGLASPGSGLGLAIVKAIVQRHHGRVNATSTPGAGTTMRIELPMHSTVIQSETHFPL